MTRPLFLIAVAVAMSDVYLMAALQFVIIANSPLRCSRICLIEYSAVEE